MRVRERAAHENKEWLHNEIKQINYYINSEQYDGLVIDIDDSGGLTVEKNGIKKAHLKNEQKKKRA